MKQSWTMTSLFALRCPVCGANTFKTGLYKTAKVCAQCKENFEPEQGFYAGAIYPMYGMGAFVAGTTGLMVALLGGSFSAMLIYAGLVLAVFSPWIFWYARLSFLHTNHRFFKD